MDLCELRNDERGVINVDSWIFGMHYTLILNLLFDREVLKAILEILYKTSISLSSKRNGHPLFIISFLILMVLFFSGLSRSRIGNVIIKNTEFRVLEGALLRIESCMQ